MNIIQYPGILLICASITAIVFLIVWIFFIAESKFYQTYKHNRKIRLLMGDINRKRLEKKRMLLKEKLLALQIINTSKEDIEEAEKFLGVELQPIVFEDNVIAHELACMRYTHPVTKKAIEMKLEEGIIPIRMHFASPISGIDESQIVSEYFEQRYPHISFLALNLFLSPLFIDTLLTKEIILLEIVYYKVDYSNGVDVLLVPYQRKRYSSSAKYTPPVYVDELVK